MAAPSEGSTVGNSRTDPTITARSTCARSPESRTSSPTAVEVSSRYRSETTIGKELGNCVPAGRMLNETAIGDARNPPTL